MDWSRFFEWILSHGAWELLTIAYGVFVGYLKRENSTWFLSALWGAIGALIMATTLYVGSLINQHENPTSSGSAQGSFCAKVGQP